MSRMAEERPNTREKGTLDRDFKNERQDREWKKGRNICPITMRYK